MKILVLADAPVAAEALARLLERSEAVAHAQAIDARTVVLVDGTEQSAAAWLAGAIEAVRTEVVTIRARPEDRAPRVKYQHLAFTGRRSKGDRRREPRWPRPK